MFCIHAIELDILIIYLILKTCIEIKLIYSLNLFATEKLVYILFNSKIS